MSNDEKQLLASHGWEVECEMPLELRHETSGDFVTGGVARNLIDKLKQDLAQKRIPLETHAGIVVSLKAQVAQIRENLLSNIRNLLPKEQIYADWYVPGYTGIKYIDQNGSFGLYQSHNGERSPNSIDDLDVEALVQVYEKMLDYQQALKKADAAIAQHFSNAKERHT